MRRILIFTCLLLLGFAPILKADYHNPPGWEDNLYFTHQSWDFNTNQATDLAPDGGYDNPFGTPLFNITGENPYWRDRIFGREGIWYAQPGDKISVHVPNEYNRELYKEVWLQATIFTSLTDEEVEMIFTNPVIELSAPGGTCTTTDFSIESTGEDYDWKYVTVMYRIIPQPGWETINFDFANIDGTVKFDELDIDTRCVPEPSTASFVLSLMGAGILLFRKRK